ncbi:hypothetical protein [Embleya sp. AB8]|uniref:hypothetical protein n=1 Tax=Embleya sp. AB8 TaxID=3156304 RepID=UPI003C77E7DB
MPSRHADRPLPVDPGARALARRRSETVRDLPTLSPHRLDRDEAFAAAEPVSVNSRKALEP